MRHSSRVCRLACAVLVALIAARAGAGSEGTERPVARLVQSLEARYKNASSFRAVFLERRSEGPSSIQVESGTLYIRRPGMMRWEYESPEQKLFLVDGKNAWFYVPADRTATKAPVRDSDDARIPLLLLTGKASLARVCRRIELADTHVEAAGNTALRCLPANGGEEYKEAVFEVDSQSHLVRLLVREPGNVETEFHFGKWEENVSLDAALFHFSPPKGTVIVDERSLLGNPGGR